jgi:hypothetical protein
MPCFIPHRTVCPVRPVRPAGVTAPFATRHCCAPRRCRKGIHQSDPQSGVVFQPTGDLGRRSAAIVRAVESSHIRNARCRAARTYTSRPTRQDGDGKQNTITRQTNRAGSKPPRRRVDHLHPRLSRGGRKHHLIPLVALGNKPIHQHRCPRLLLLDTTRPLSWSLYMGAPPIATRCFSDSRR